MAGTISASESFFSQFCRWQFLLELCMQLTFSIVLLQLTTSVAIMRVLRFYCSYAGGTFCYSYVGGSFCSNYVSDCFCCNYAVRGFCSTYAGDSSKWQFYIPFSNWHPHFIKLTGKKLKAFYQICISQIFKIFFQD